MNKDIINKINFFLIWVLKMRDVNKNYKKNFIPKEQLGYYGGFMYNYLMNKNTMRKINARNLGWKHYSYKSEKYSIKTKF